ncbi:MAG: hypothetical protein KAV83_09910 [Desulfobacterales bacterium]|nr:hypothetical protein [Desulfobacterales bacterium]
MSIILEMDGNYPDIFSGIVSFENARTGMKLTIELPKDVVSGIYGIRSITMDTGGAATILPENLAQRLDIRKPPDNHQMYYIFGGVGGMSVCYYSPDAVIVRIGDKMKQLEKNIFPFFLTFYAPSITSEGKLLARKEYQPHTSEILRFISPPFQHHDDYTVEVCSPDEIFLPKNRRLKLEVDVGNEIDYILIGRDWQQGFKCTFEAQKIMLMNRFDSA